LSASPAEVIAIHLTQAIGANAFPAERYWGHAVPIRFCHDWQGKNRDPQRQTEVRLLWTNAKLYVRFRCRYRTIHIFPDAGINGRRNQLWERDVAEIFLQPDRFGEKYYKEFEVSPHGQWLDLDISPRGLAHLASGMQSRVELNRSRRVWTADLGIPMPALTPRFLPARSWRVNFFRCEGTGRLRFYSAWQPTGTAEPNFHVPEEFGRLRFEP